MDIYRMGIRPLLFSGLNVDPEWLHDQTLKVLSQLDQMGDRSSTRWLQQALHRSCGLTQPQLEQTLWGLNFPNPIGLAAGFDKDGTASGMWSVLGFGFAELGTITYHAQPGNPRPRLFRLLPDEAVLNRMGFNNQGAAAMAKRLQQRWSTEVSPPLPHPIPLGINLGKSKITPLEEAAEDYRQSFRLLQNWGDYFVINVSSPNTPGLRSLQSTEHLAPILAALQQENQQNKPLLIKIAPDLEWQEITAIVELAQNYHLAGIIATNTTICRDDLKTEIIPATGQPVHSEAGGISGAPLRQRSTEVIRLIYQKTAGELPIIGVGGIFTAADAWEKIIAGASLVQTYTGWVYEGPWMVRRILTGLQQYLADHELTHIAEAVGLEHKNRILTQQKSVP